MQLDQELRQAARNAVVTCMGVAEHDRVWIVGDEQTALVAEALHEQAEMTGARVERVELEAFVSRPSTELTTQLVDKLDSFDPSVSFLAVSAQPGEVKMRMQYIAHVVGNLKARHAHMGSITPEIMRQGMSVDYREIQRITVQVFELLKRTSEVEVTSSGGSDLRARISPDLKWVPCTGIYHEPAEWGNLPDGEVYTSPASLDGVLVADVVGDYFSAKYGVLEQPVTVEFEAGYVKNIGCENRELEVELLDYLESAENGKRVGEFAIGTNIGLRQLTGSLLLDEKIPGVHMAMGDPAGMKTGADWVSEVHVDMVPRDCTVHLDGQLLMQDGEFKL